MDKIDELIRNRKKAHARRQELGSPVYAGFLEMERVFGRS